MSHNMNRRNWLSTFAVAAACAALGAAFPAAAQQTLKFGLAMPLTGSQSSYGKDQIKATEWAVADINAKGGVAGKKLEVIVLDTQGRPDGRHQRGQPADQRRQGAGVRHRVERRGQGGRADRQSREGARAFDRRQRAGNLEAR
jgi:hypothetical protein